MKRNDAGYALPLVLVVMTILSLLAVTVMTFSLDSFQSQQASVARMQAKYEAQGRIERAIGKLQGWRESTNILIERDHTTVEGDGNTLTVTASDAGETVWVVAEIELHGISQEIAINKVSGYYSIEIDSVPDIRYVSYEVMTENPLPEDNSTEESDGDIPSDEDGGA